MRAIMSVPIIIAAAIGGCDNRQGEPVAQAPKEELLPMEKVPRRDFVRAMNLCPRLPTGAWQVGDYEIRANIFSVTDEEAAFYANKVIEITEDQVLVGDQTCKIDEIQVDTYQWSFETTERAHYIYFCSNERTMTFSFGPDCAAPEFKFKEAVYDAVELDSL